MRFSWLVFQSTKIELRAQYQIPISCDPQAGLRGLLRHYLEDCLSISAGTVSVWQALCETRPEYRDRSSELPEEERPTITMNAKLYEFLLVLTVCFVLASFFGNSVGYGRGSHRRGDTGQFGRD